GPFHALHPVSAKTGDGIAALRDELIGLLPEGPLYFPQEQRTDLSLELQLAELVREKALWLTRDEVPHAISVELEEVEEKVVRASILVETDSQKQILVGKGGAMVKDIGTRAPPEIEPLLGHSVFLELRVKVRPKWRRDAATLERLGLWSRPGGRSSRAEAGAVSQRALGRVSSSRTPRSCSRSTCPREASSPFPATSSALRIRGRAK